MSIWTHVAGIVRIDGLAGMTLEPDYGRACTFEDDDAAWDLCDIPCGSEGSLVISPWVNPNGSCLSRYTGSILGDLRDFDDDQKIVDYFNRITKGHRVRQGVFTIDNGYPDDIRTYVYSKDEWVKLTVNA